MRKENENREQNIRRSIGMITLMVLILIGFSGCAVGFLGISNTASWKEEVLLHDGSKIIVERWQKHGGQHELGQEPGVSDQSISFTLPRTNKTIKWKDEASAELGGRSNFYLLALHILNGVPYIITSPRLCLSYNKWGRPNPPYVIFKYENKEWRRIEMVELPMEFQNINMVIETDGHEKELLRQGGIAVEKVQRLNESLLRNHEEYRAIIRTPIIKVGREGCPEEFYDGTYWRGVGKFKKQPSYEACKDICKQEKISDEYCPCNGLFKINKKEK